ncbi:YcaO-like family protein [Streptomyces sp. HNM0663]|uniref:YcaO-like family protein n=1 Tax=Streptomyces chengmaiensis TaxID=3040919 RepID=A0ABT6HTW2_9ACTN|nr:YcaO-like family protein [Streptomyces chengmaiensis]MDH2392157.1 YcaO-like family protein [Streptomyces chengmaiensis]
MRDDSQGGANGDSELDGLRRVEAVSGPAVRPVRGSTRLPPLPGEPPYSVFVSSIGDPTVLWSDTPAQPQGLDGAGGGVDPERARLISVAEAVERYTNAFYQPHMVRWASADELGDEAVSLQSLPRCSAAELADEANWLIDPDPSLPQRWVRGWSLTRGRPVWVPATYVWLFTAHEAYGERIANPISTGCAVHSDVHQALVNGICEAVERDAISLVWLQRLELPEIDVSDDPAFTAQRDLVRDGFVEYRFYDATTDVGVPTVYAVVLSDHHESLGQLVMCASGPDPVGIVRKIYREAASSRIALQMPHQVPDDPQDFTSVLHGAIRMGRPEQRDAFDFLLKRPRPTRSLADLPSAPAADPAEQLAWLVQRLDAIRAEVIAVELTTSEARHAGLRSVRVIVPGLMPLSFVHRNRYLGHPRLYRAPEAMGFTSRPEHELNPHPQPFA